MMMAVIVSGESLAFFAPFLRFCFVLHFPFLHGKIPEHSMFTERRGQQ